MTALSRRELLTALAAATLTGCRCNGESPALQGADTPATLNAEWQELRFAPDAHYDKPEMAALLMQPEAPILVALHGRGESGRGLEVGARGWRDDYRLDAAHARLQKPPLTREDFLGFVDDERLQYINQALAEQPYGGLAVACPYAPALDDHSVKGAEPFGRFVTQSLLPKVRQALGNSDAPAGIDGVSMGGRLALLIGLTHPEVFHSVSAMQPAISPQETAWLSDLAAEAQQRGLRALRLVSSEGDPFLPAVEGLSRTLRGRKISHELVITPGPHDYVWNRGPGSYEMLFWHDRKLNEG